jgi:hypothetical protein
MAIGKDTAKRIVTAYPSEYPDIIMDLMEDGQDELATFLKNALEAYNKFQAIVRFGGDKEKRDMHAAEYEANMLEVAERLFSYPETVVSSKVYDDFEKVLKEVLSPIAERKSKYNPLEEPIVSHLSDDLILVSDIIDGRQVQTLYRTRSAKEATEKFKAAHHVYYKSLKKESTDVKKKTKKY